MKRLTMTAGLGLSALLFWGSPARADDKNRDKKSDTLMTDEEIDEIFDDVSADDPYKSTTSGSTSTSSSGGASSYGSTYGSTPSSAPTSVGTTSPTLATLPPETEVEDIRRYTVRPNRPMIWTGLGLLGVSYTASAVLSADSSRPSDQYLLVPVAGPWLALAHRDCGAMPCNHEDDADRVLLIADGVFQGMGALLMLGGLIVPETIEEVKKPTVKVTPVSVRGGGGVGVTGTF
jgi:hypothetical protein